MNKPIHSRKFQVDFYEQDEQLWRITSRLDDDIHDIRAELEVSAPDMIVRRAKVEFLRYPLEECLQAPAQMGELVGACLFTDYSERIRRLFLGPSGCPNVLNLLVNSAPAMIYFYFPDQIKKGKMKPEEWWKMCATSLSNACLAHQLLAKQTAGAGGMRG